MPHSIIIPKKFTPRSDREYFEILAKSIFQAGFNWHIVERKWPSITKAFLGFDLYRVSRMTDHDLDQLLKNPGVIRNGRKIQAIIENARKIRQLSKEHGSFRKFLSSNRTWKYPERRKFLVKQFASVGQTALFVFLYTVNEPVPHWHRRKG